MYQHPLYKYINDNGMTVPEFSRKIGVTPVTVRYWLHGRNVPSLEKFETMKKVSGGKIKADFFKKEKQSKP